MVLLSIQSLGTLSITLDSDQHLPFDSNKTRALLVYLAVESTMAHTRDKLAALLWSNCPASDARHSLRQALSNIRRVTGDHQRDEASRLILSSRQTIQFNRASDYWLDVALFQTLPRDHIQSHSIACYEKAIQTYHGGFLTGFNLLDVPLFEEWVVVQRERWHRKAVQTLVLLVNHYQLQYDLQKALAYAQLQVELDPWREDAHQQVMRLLALTGQRTAALAQFEKCNRILKEHLQTKPEPETLALVQAIKAGELTVGTRHPTPLLVKAPIHKHNQNLPVPLTTCIGREAEITTITSLIKDAACRLLTLVGPGGIGKTRVAQEVAQRLEPSFRHGAALVNLGELLSTSNDILSLIAKSLGFRFVSGDEPQDTQFYNYLKNKNLLLILDNAEHLLQHLARDTKTSPDHTSLTDVITTILQQAHGVSIIITSRLTLNILGEHLFPLHALPYPAQSVETLEDIQRYPAVQLFVQSAQRLQPTFHLNAHNAHAVSYICRYVQGIPLALLLTAAWVPAMSTTNIMAFLSQENAEETSRGLNLLRIEWANVEPRHRDLRVVYQQSWRLLNPEAQNLCAALSVFRGTFTLQEVLAITGTKLEKLRELVNVSFLEVNAEGIYSVHPLLHQFASEKLAEDAIYQRHIINRYSTHYINALEQWEKALIGPRQAQALAEMDAAHPNIAHAWEWALSQDNVAAIDKGIQGLCQYYLSRIRYKDAHAACQLAADKIEALLAASPSAKGTKLRILVKVLTWSSTFSPLAEREPLLQRCLDILEQTEVLELDTQAEKAAVLYNKANMLLNQDRTEAQACYKESLRLYETIHNLWGQSRVLYYLAFLYWHIGDYQQAQYYGDQCLTLTQQSEDYQGIANALQVLSGVAMLTGKVERAAELSEECLAYRRKTGDRAAVASGLYSLGVKYIALGRAGDAVSILEESQKITFDELGQQNGLVISMLAWARMWMGHYKEAQKLGQEALSIIEKSHDQRGQAWIHFVLGSIAVGLTTYEIADKLLTKSVQIYRSLNQRQELTMALGSLVYSLWGQHRDDEIPAYLVEALHIWQDIRSPQTLAFPLIGMALLTLRQKKTRQALEHYAMAATITPCVENCTWFWDVAGRFFDEKAASLDPAEVEAAQQRGRALDVDATVADFLATYAGAIG